MFLQILACSLKTWTLSSFVRIAHIPIRIGMTLNRVMWIQIQIQVRNSHHRLFIASTQLKHSAFLGLLICLFVSGFAPVDACWGCSTYSHGIEDVWEQ